MRIILIIISSFLFTTTVYAAEYPSAGFVVDTSNDVVTYIESNGNIFSFCGAEDYCIGDIVAVIRDDNNTDVVYDDIHITEQYVGFLYEASAEAWCDVYNEFILDSRINCKYNTRQ